MGRKFGFSFSAKRALGISAAKGRISRKIGIPLTRSGRQRKIGRIASGGKCFVATACYDDPDHPTIKALRRFRDDFLRQRRIGRRVIMAYYSIGPWLARIVRRSHILRSCARSALNMFAAFVHTKG